MWDWGTYFLFVSALCVGFPFLWEFDRKKTFHGVLLIAGLLPTFLLLFLRGRSVGIDLEAYEVHVRLAEDFQFSNLIFSFGEPLAEVIYRISYLCGGLRAFICITAFLEYVFIYIAFKRLHEKGIDISIIFIFFFAVVILRSFNIVLNCLAVTCSLCAYVHLLDQDRTSKYKYWFYTVIALGLHNTAVINIPIYFLCAPIGFHSDVRRAILKRVVLMVISVVVIYALLLRYLDVISSFNEGQYSRYESSENGLGWGIILAKVPFILLVWCLRKPLYSRFNTRYLPFLLLLFFDLVFAQTRYIFSAFQRFSMYTDIGRIMLVGFICMALYDRHRKHAGLVVMVGLLYGIFVSFTYWLYTYEILGGDGNGIGLMPYRFWP